MNTGRHTGSTRAFEWRNFKKGCDPASEGTEEVSEKFVSDSVQSNKVEILGQLAGGVVHDFNNILGAMMMQLHLIMVAPGLTPEIAEQIKDIDSLAVRAAGLTNQLLMFSRKQETLMERLNINAILEGTLKMLGGLIGAHISFEARVAKEPLWIDADKGMVEQVLMNLCVNARDAMLEGGRLAVESRLEVRGPTSARPGRYACLVVTDSGLGMDLATRSRIFEPFFTTKPTGKGTGLGLSTVNGILNLHNGWIEVDSAPGCGSTFRALFPLKDAAPVAEIAKAPAHDLEEGTGSVLLVEDDDAIRAVVSKVLQRSGYHVTEASSATDAVRIWYENRYAFDVLLTDFILPGGLNGAQLAEKFVADKSSLRAILMSGYSTAPGGTPFSLPERTVHLVKPFKTKMLLETVRQCLDANKVEPPAIRGPASL